MSFSKHFEPFIFDGQKNTRDLGLPTDGPFPLAIRPQSSAQPTLQESIDALREVAQSGELYELVKQHGGAVLIRGLPIRTADEYSAVAHAFGFRPHEEVGRPPNRTVLAKNVKTANEGYATFYTDVEKGLWADRIVDRRKCPFGRIMNMDGRRSIRPG